MFKKGKTENQHAYILCGEEKAWKGREGSI